MRSALGGAAAALLVAACHPRVAAQEHRGDVRACIGGDLEWSVVRSACACSRLRELDAAAHADCGAFADPRDVLHAVVSSDETSGPSGRTLAVRVRFTNVGARPARMTIGGPPRMLVFDSKGEPVPVDDPSRTSVDGLPCDPTEVGEVELNRDPGEVWLEPNGTLTETVAWRAAHARRELRTCGWNYRELEPGHYVLRLHWPQSSDVIGELAVTVTPPAPCRPTCASPPGAVALPFARYPKLADIGQSVSLEAKGYSDPVCHKDLVLVGHALQGFVAVSGSCTDSCCPASFEASSFACPWCEASRRWYASHPGVGPPGRDISQAYDVEGRPPPAGPATQPLQKLPLCADECGVYVQLP